MGQQAAVWTRIAKDGEGRKTGGGLIPAVEGHRVEQNRTEWNKIELWWAKRNR